ncbi:hypothetical protein HYPSUDRAFT_64335 [Hypholoma sublateritium FD-334 SS-4]|uniref:Uncharacterized protein n=1 Tax=Hypholoma sublateritium (strain FD-334 SS-4) TaxID=945553 RepID=A0A0D2MQ79_HYPSF|nr:hypothetical protein HYPSUDRAFT_64335 [Hypholoma sublateritium FD-334 SS-4]
MAEHCNCKWLCLRSHYTRTYFHRNGRIPSQNNTLYSYSVQQIPRLRFLLYSRRNCHWRLSPPLLLEALFISPPAPSDVSLLAYGHSTITHWRGQGREAHSLKTFSSCNPTFLLLDASELDTVSNSSTKTADLHPLYLIRDLNTGLLALRGLQIMEISSPLWAPVHFLAIQLSKRSFWRLPELELELQSTLP